MRNARTSWTLAAIITVVGWMAANQALAANDEQDVRQAAGQFYTALNAMFTGDVGPMGGIWSHASDVTYMGPGGGFLVGWDQVRPTWEAQAAKKLGGKVEPADLRVTVGRDLAVVSNYEMGENTNANGKVEKVSIRATNLFRKEDGKWKMVGHHTDVMPWLAK